MSLKCPACGMDCADGAAFCDFCKEPFLKKKDPLKGLTKEEVEKLSAEQFLKRDLPERPALPAWVRPAAWTFLALMLALAGMLMSHLSSKYQGPAAAAPSEELPPNTERVRIVE